MAIIDRGNMARTKSTMKEIACGREKRFNFANKFIDIAGVFVLA
jgi:hypothetical protein